MTLSNQMPVFRSRDQPRSITRLLHHQHSELATLQTASLGPQIITLQPSVIHSHEELKLRAARRIIKYFDSKISQEGQNRDTEVVDYAK